MKISNMNVPANIKIPDFGEFFYKTSNNFSSRDPFILSYSEKYFLYACAGKKGICCYESDDLENWSKPIIVYTPPENFFGIKDLFWAPECHYYNGKFYIFTSVFSSYTNHRNISVYCADNPFGPFACISSDCIGKLNWDTIDGTLYIDQYGKPWLAFVHEWTSQLDHIGGMAVARLSEDLSKIISEPKEIFKAMDTPFAKNNVTDGPYLYQTEKGRLIMIWSNHGEKGYFIAKAYSDTGIDGEWKHEKELLYEQKMKPEFLFDGGHGMIFQSKEGKIILALHAPNKKSSDMYEHLLLLELQEKGNTIRVK